MAPRVADRISGVVERISTEGLPMLLVEPNLPRSLQVERRRYVLEQGAITLESLRRARTSGAPNSASDPRPAEVA